MTQEAEAKIKNLIELVCNQLQLDAKIELKHLGSLIVNYPRYIPERVFAHIIKLFGSSDIDYGFSETRDFNELEKIVQDNYIWGELNKIDDITVSSGNVINKKESILYRLLDGEVIMRVNVLNPKFLSDQHLVAEYREVKMGPKALSKSLFSKKGVDKNRISPTYTLNTGHTYFFYDKNEYLKGRLSRIVEEMKSRGIQTNFVNLIDDDYDYHPSTFKDEYWNDWTPDEAALAINMERINQRFSMKPDGWYKFWGRPVLDTEDLIKTRLANEFYECPSCKAIHTKESILNGEKICWNCCSKLPDNLELSCYC